MWLAAAVHGSCLGVLLPCGGGLCDAPLAPPVLLRVDLSQLRLRTSLLVFLVSKPFFPLSLSHLPSVRHLCFRAVGNRNMLVRVSESCPFSETSKHLTSRPSRKSTGWRECWGSARSLGLS